MSDTNAGFQEVDLSLARDQSEQDRQDWRDLGVAVHGPPEQRVRDITARLTWAATEPDTTWVVRVRADGRLVSFLWIIQRSILIDGSPVRAAGIRGVMTQPGYRRRGFGRTALLRATEFIWRTLQPDLPLLLSSVVAVPFYQGIGWEIIEGPVLCQQPDVGAISYSEVIPEAPTMVLVPAGGQLPEGVVDLCGLPW